MNSGRIANRANQMNRPIMIRNRFTAYSRLCQDLVNLIEGQDDMEVKLTEETNVPSELPVIADVNDSNKTEESSILHIQSLGSHYSENNTENHKEDADKENIEKLTETLANSENECSEETDDNTFVFVSHL